ncbi:MAG: DNA-directed DNA polymerase I [Desulfurococcaceae archaeon]
MSFANASSSKTASHVDWQGAPFRQGFARSLKTFHYLLGVYYDGRLGKAVMEFLSEDGARLIMVPDLWDHKPYFITDEDVEALRAKLGSEKSVERFEEVEKINPLTMQKVKLVKVVTRDPLAVRKVRSSVKNAWEAKIKYHANYTFDMGLIPGMRYAIVNEDGYPKLVLAEPRIPEDVARTINDLFSGEPESTRKLAVEFAKLFEEPPPRAMRVAVDIEVYTPFKGRVPNPRLAEYPIISIAMAGSDGYRKVFISVRPYKSPFLYAAEEIYPSNAEVEIFDSEQAMILEFYRAVSGYPVVLTYNGDKFDLLYLYTRSLKIGIPRSLVPIRVREDLVKFESSIHLDLYRFFSNKAIKNYAFGGRYQEERLEAVSQALLGVTKIGFEETVSDVSAGLLVAYNLRDAEITLMLTTFSNELVWKLIILMARISKTSVEELCRRQISGWIQNLFFWEHRRLNYLIPNKEDIANYVRSATKAVIEGKKYAGALVIVPPQGVFFDVVVLDIASLYPSVIKNFNLSYETVDMNWCSSKQKIVDETGKVIHTVCTDMPGLTAQITGILRDFRVGIYKKRSKNKSLSEELRVWYDVVQRAIKVFINASYGVFGDERFSLYSPAVAESVTALGRRSFMSIVVKAAEMGIKTLYGDTDSIFVWSPTPKQLELLQKWIQRNLDLDIEVDKEFTFIVFTGLRKNYLGRTSNGEVEVKGLVAKKRNTPEFVKSLFGSILDSLKKVESPEDFAAFMNWLEKVMKEHYYGLKQKEITLDMLAIKTALTKDPSAYTKNKPPHVKAALQLRKHGMNIQEGDIIVLVKVKGGDGYKAIQLARQHEVDTDKYIEMLRSGLEQLLLALGIKWEDVAGGSDLARFTRNLHS